MPDYTNVDYEKITTGDRNPIKRLLQSNRLNDGLRILKDVSPNFTGQILDFGAGNGILCRRLRERLPHAALVCYEPVDNLRKQAHELLRGVNNVEVVGSLTDYSPESFEFIFCLEVFEHLPKQQTLDALGTLKKLLKPGGRLVIGVPNEVFLPALIKGAFRMRRRYGADDARIGNVLRATAGFPPKVRDVVDFGGFPYHLRHMGFDHRAFRVILSQFFRIEQVYGSPNPKLPLLANFEVYFVCNS